MSRADYPSAVDLSSKVALFNVNYRRPYLVVTLAEVSLLSSSAAPVVGTDTSKNVINNATQIEIKPHKNATASLSVTSSHHTTVRRRKKTSHSPLCGRNSQNAVN